MNVNTTWRIGSRLVIRFGIAFTMLCLGICAATAQDSADVSAEATADPSGTWKWEREFRDNVMRSTLVLTKAENNNLTGTLRTVFGDGGGPGNNDPVKIDNGKIEGDKVTFSVTRNFNGNEFTVNYVGTYADGKLGGKYTLDFGNGSREFDWDATRSQSVDDLVGKWNIHFEGPDGNAIDSAMTLKKEESGLVGTYHSSFFGDAPMTQIKLSDGELSFVVVFKNDNGEFEVQYKAKPVGDEMKGTITASFGGQTNETPFEAKRDK